MTADPLIERDHLVSDLRGAVHEGESGLSQVPRLLRRVLETEAWRERYDTKSRESVKFVRFTDFVTSVPTGGLGATDDLIDRIVGTSDPDLLKLLRRARAGKPGRPRKTEETPLDSNGISQGEASDYTAARLAREAPEEYEAVKRGEKKLNTAALAAGIRRPRASVYVDNPASAARTLRKHLTAEQCAELARLLTDEDN